MPVLATLARTWMSLGMKTYSGALSAEAATTDLMIMMLVVAWALVDVVYFSLPVGIPTGIASSAITHPAQKRPLKTGDGRASP